MAKVTAPFLSLSARGTIAGALTSSNWKGINTMRIKSTPSNPKTVGQMKVRAYLALGGKITKKADLTGTTVAYLKSKTPAQQSWASYFVREVLGTQNVNIEAAKTFYANVANATVKGFFDDAAAQAGIEAVDLDGTVNTQISAGLILLAAYSASNRLGDTAAPAAIAGVTEVQVFAYTDALTGVQPS